jgi:NADP-reducing hydrogenase subunit HndB
MAKLTLEELRKLRETETLKIIRREPERKDAQILVSMGTCGIAAGAKETLDIFLDALNEHKLVESTLVRQVACLGHCNSEPVVEVAVAGMPLVIYGKVNTELAKEIISKHIIGRQLLESHILEKSAANDAASKGGN